MCSIYCRYVSVPSVLLPMQATVYNCNPDGTITVLQAYSDADVRDTHTYSLTHTHTLTHILSHTHTHTHTLSHMHSHTHHISRTAGGDILHVCVDI